jgi:hypothetical protein
VFAHKEVYESERVTRDPGDLGVVRNSVGEQVGVVVRISGEGGALVTWLLDPGWRERVAGGGRFGGCG